MATQKSDPKTTTEEPEAEQDASPQEPESQFQPEENPLRTFAEDRMNAQQYTPQEDE